LPKSQELTAKSQAPHNPLTFNPPPAHSKNHPSFYVLSLKLLYFCSIPKKYFIRVIRMGVTVP
ncbi:hypothetical protein, partial [Marinilabilia sp.]|uniref:hypothetical protein n=1 Tax=Marinilabilia sp. TaxID=2021252 RepID=UPI0025BA3BDE